MNKKRLFKEIETNVGDVLGRPGMSFDDIDRIFNDLCFSKSGLDIHTLRTAKRLFASIRLTYKAMLENEQLDINDTHATVYLSRKKVKKLIKKSLKISKKDRDINESDMDELDDYLAPEEPSLAISKEETIELINGSIGEALEPFLGTFEALQTKLKELEGLQAKTPKKAVKGNAKKPKEDIVESEELPSDLELEDEVSDADLDAVEQETKRK